MLLGYRTGNNKPILQIERKYYMNRICHYTELPSASPIKDWIKMLWVKDHIKLQYDPRTIYNSSNLVVYDDDIKERVFSFHSRLHINGQDFCTRDTCKEFNYDDSWVEINGLFYSIDHILCDTNNSIYIVGQQAVSKKIYYNLFSFNLSNQKRVIKINNTIRQCIKMQIRKDDITEEFISRGKFHTQID